jgi:prepilin-type processing-associated H-X9-DG protein
MPRKLISIVGIAVAVIALVVVLEHRRGRLDRELACKANLKTIYAALEDYSHKNGRYPESLEELAIPQSRLREGPQCPASRKGYVLLARGTPVGRMEAGSILVVDPEAAHGGKAQVLYGDGEVGEMTQTRLEALIKLVHYRPAVMPMPQTRPATQSDGN